MGVIIAGISGLPKNVESQTRKAKGNDRKMWIASTVRFLPPRRQSSEAPPWRRGWWVSLTLHLLQRSSLIVVMSIPNLLFAEERSIDFLAESIDACVANKTVLESNFDERQSEMEKCAEVVHNYCLSEIGTSARNRLDCSDAEYLAWEEKSRQLMMELEALIRFRDVEQDEEESLIKRLQTSHVMWLEYMRADCQFSTQRWGPTPQAEVEALECPANLMARRAALYSIWLFQQNELGGRK